VAPSPFEECVGQSAATNPHKTASSSSAKRSTWAFILLIFFTLSWRPEPRAPLTLQLKHIRKMAAALASFQASPPPLPLSMSQVWCCRSQIAALYILLECKVLICDDGYFFHSFSFLLRCIFIVNLLFDREPPVYDEDTFILFKCLRETLMFNILGHKFRKIIVFAWSAWNRLCFVCVFFDCDASCLI